MQTGLLEADLQVVKRLLEDLLVCAEADDCLVCDSGGYVLAQEGAGERDQYMISALGAGVFGASRELARLLGENEFSAVLHQGEKRSIFLLAIDADHLLVVIFSRQANTGLVKLYAGPTTQKIRQLFTEVQQRPAGSAAAAPTFVLREQSDLFTG